MPEEFAHADITRRIIGSAMAVHRALGSGFQEVIYQRALELEMTAQRLEFSREHEMEVFYRGVKIGMRRVDFFVEECVMVEIKALHRLEDVHLAQTINYLEAYDLQIGMLLNFGAQSLEYKRVMRPRKASS